MKWIFIGFSLGFTVFHSVFAEGATGFFSSGYRDRVNQRRENRPDAESGALIGCAGGQRPISARAAGSFANPSSRDSPFSVLFLKSEFHGSFFLSFQSSCIRFYWLGLDFWNVSSGVIEFFFSRFYWAFFSNFAFYFLDLMKLTRVPLDISIFDSIFLVLTVFLLFHCDGTCIYIVSMLHEIESSFMGYSRLFFQGNLMNIEIRFRVLSVCFSFCDRWKAFRD